MQCPACSGQVIEAGWNGHAFSLCCDMPFVIIQNWEVFEALPADLRQVAIDQDRIERAKMIACAADNAQRFGEWGKAATARWPHLFNCEPSTTPY